MPAGAHPSVVQELLEQIRGDFYHDLPPQHFFRDRRMLLYALSWPATWLQQRALTMHPPRYRKLILLCLNQIKTHADRDKLAVYFPAYLLKSLQQYLFHHGDSLYEELKHVRNALEPLMQKFPQSNPEDSNRLVSTLAHLLLLNRPTPFQAPLPDFLSPPWIIKIIRTRKLLRRYNL